jgi:mannose-6-phosphate isomerase
MELILSSTLTKDKVFEKVRNELEQYGFTIVNFDNTRPWGGFYVIDEKQADQFVEFFFQGIDQTKLASGAKISPKILIVEKEKRLSWQYHHRRSELWKVIGGEVGLITSPDDRQRELQVKHVNDIITLKQGERHRLVGLKGWGIVAEIWQHTDPKMPSDENDIVRVEDDFGR